MGGLLARLGHLPTTGFGLVAGGIVLFTFKSLGCQLPSDWLTWGVGLIAALPGLLAKA